MYKLLERLRSEGVDIWNQKRTTKFWWNLCMVRYLPFHFLSIFYPPPPPSPPLREFQFHPFRKVREDQRADSLPPQKLLKDPTCWHSIKDPSPPPQTSQAINGGEGDADKNRMAHCVQEQWAQQSAELRKFAYTSNCVFVGYMPTSCIFLSSYK